ncbi:hypothetical protein [Streptomyces violaceorubidus]|uniref:hypothetical protein n=1 Tax=Streptomyces violaceorubidus TaxID=284042 RepID=UPI0004BFC0EF|nr:hypothetical protein [Streptomyces violaceorubidus]
MNQPEDSAASRFRDLTAYMRERPVTGPEGHSYIGNTPRGTATHPGLPINVRVLEHVDRTVAEVVQYTRENNPAAAPVPQNVQDVYRWCVENTVNAPEAEQQRRETLEYKHQLEHAVAAGDVAVIRPHRCPECGTFGLMWDNLKQRIVCTNLECVDEDGLTTIVEFARLAHLYVAARKNIRQVRAT